jgi:sulfur-oxidizing protein SoxZ
MATRTLIHLPKRVRAGEVFEIRTTLGHPMETGYRPDAEGRPVPRDLMTRFECRLDGALVFAADCHPAVAANPYLAFMLRAERSGTLVFSWDGDRGFRHTEQAALVVV